MSKNVKIFVGTEGEPERASYANLSMPNLDELKLGFAGSG
jgi:hypothetical protein